MNLQYTGEERIPARPDAVWAFVTDPEKVARCFPDVVDFTVVDQNHVDAVVQVNVGPVRGQFKLKVELRPDQSNRRVDMKVAGTGFGSAVDMTAQADVMPATDTETILKWSGQAVARGKIAAVGGRVLDGQAKRLISQAFGNVRSQMTPPSAAAPVELHEREGVFARFVRFLRALWLRLSGARGHAS